MRKRDMKKELKLLQRNHQALKNGYDLMRADRNRLRELALRFTEWDDLGKEDLDKIRQDTKQCLRNIQMRESLAEHMDKLELFGSGSGTELRGLMTTPAKEGQLTVSQMITKIEGEMADLEQQRRDREGL